MNWRYAIVVGLLLCSTAAGQARRPATGPPSADPTQVGSIKARVILESGNSVSHAVQVTLSNARGTQSRLYSDNQGQFEIRNLPPGEYTLQVEGDRLVYEVISERLDVLAGTPTVVTLTLKEKSNKGTTRPAAPSASVAELSKDIPPKARKEFERASALSREGKTAEAIERLRKAIEIYPTFMMAHNDLGALLLDQGHVDEAIAELLRALELDRKAFNPHLNLGVAYLRQQRLPEAVDVLRKATSLESTSGAAHLYLGIALKASNDFAAAERELHTAYDLGGAAFAEALFYLGQVYMNMGERTLARQAFELYLQQQPQAANAAEARRLVSILR